MKYTPLPSIEYLRECFEEKDGVLYWKMRPRHHFAEDRTQKIFNRFVGTAAGRADSDGRIQIGVGKYGRFIRSRIVFALYHGYDPGISLIDHKDCDIQNDRIDNLRLANHSQNISNTKKMNVKGLSSKYKGVCFSKSFSKYQAYITIKKKRMYLGYFSTEEEAYAARCEAADKYHGEFARYE